VYVSFCGFLTGLAKTHTVAPQRAGTRPDLHHLGDMTGRQCRPAIRVDRRHWWQHLLVEAAAGSDAAWDTRDRRRRRSLCRRSEPAADGTRDCTLRAAGAAGVHRQGALRRTTAPNRRIEAGKIRPAIDRTYPLRRFPPLSAIWMGPWCERDEHDASCGSGLMALYVVHALSPVSSGPFR
jgi:hypothetical protein